jgi:CheY-like chemotaxis protein
MRGSVLIVHDDLSVRRWLGEFLGTKGYRVLAASTGQEALAVLEEDLPALLVIGASMPLMSGWKLVEALAHYPDLARIPRLLVTAELEPARVCELAVELLEKKPSPTDPGGAARPGDAVDVAAARRTANA